MCHKFSHVKPNFDGLFADFVCFITAKFVMKFLIQAHVAPRFVYETDRFTLKRLKWDFEEKNK